MRVALASVSLTAGFGLGDVVCRSGNSSQGECQIDGTGCAGESVEFEPYTLAVSTWDRSSNSSVPLGEMTSYAIAGALDTWQMYLHGPLIRPEERAANDILIPPMYVHGTWVNKIYKFENFTRGENGAMKATQKVVGHALAPSTGWAVTDPATQKVKGMLVAEGQPFWFANEAGAPPLSLYKGGVTFLGPKEEDKCSQIFPGKDDPFHRMTGQVVNTVDCNRAHGVCFFTVWKFYDDQAGLWTNHTTKQANDCLHYCLAEDLDTSPRCTKIGVVADEHGEPICHKEGVGAVHGMTIGNSDASDATRFDIFLVFTGKATFETGESSMKKVTVQVSKNLFGRHFKVVKSAPFATDLFVGMGQARGDVGGDHAWVDDTGKFVWISAFRLGGAGLHMVEYETGKLLFSVTGVDKYLKDNYSYAAGIHGTGTLGQKGSYLALATSACTTTKMCAPLPWKKPFPKQLWAKGVMFVLDLASMKNTTAEAVVV
mmetsp:Transcript_17694/g.38960  ORF Transcript_17694/g.38960 Transcript_17694/m.38960 type:complete len:485 (-) Transcript_17694:355-1809(-)